MALALSTTSAMPPVEEGKRGRGEGSECAV
jgi:hypothetical protein